MDWYEQSFGRDYLLIYKHRSREAAAEEIGHIMDWLDLPSNSSILDLCCGTGRHAIVLAEAGHRVTGVDLSEDLLQAARAADPENAVRWIRSDMRSLPLTNLERFDAVLNLFTSIGYFEEDSENMKVLEQIRLALKPGGRFVIDYLNPRYLVERLVAVSTKTIEEHFITETREIQDEFVVKSITVQEKNGPARYYKERVKLYSLDSFASMLSEAGLYLDAVYGNYDESPYDESTSPRLIMAGRSYPIH